MTYVIGIDGGTKSLRAHVFDLSGRSRGVGKGPYVTTFPQPGQAEQIPTTGGTPRASPCARRWRRPE